MMFSFLGLCMLGFGLIVTLAIIALVVLAIICAIRFLRRSHNNDKIVTGSAALDILNERYAKGELSEEEYRIKKEELKK